MQQEWQKRCETSRGSQMTSLSKWRSSIIALLLVIAICLTLTVTSTLAANEPESVTDGTFLTNAELSNQQQKPSRLTSALRSYLAHSPFTQPSSIALYDPDESMGMSEDSIRESTLHATNSLRRRGQFLRKYGRINFARIKAEDVEDAKKLEWLGVKDSVHTDAFDVENDPAKVKNLHWNQGKSHVMTEDELDAYEWQVAKEQANQFGRPTAATMMLEMGSQTMPVPSSSTSKLSHPFRVQSTSSPIKQESLSPYEEGEESFLEPTSTSTDASVPIPTHSTTEIEQSSPRKNEARRRSKTADLQLPNSQITQIILWTKQHILWMINSLGDHLPQSAVDAFPKPTRNELYGYVYSLFIDPKNPNSWIDSLSNDFDDMLLLQIWQYKSFQNFFDWIQISTVMFSLREETNYPLSPIQKTRLWQRYTGLFREDINIINLGEEGELRRYCTWKWQLEYVGEVLSEADTEFYVEHLLDLARKLRTLGIRDGLIKYYQGMFLEKLAKFRLDYTYDAAVEYFENVYDVVSKAYTINQNRAAAIKAGMNPTVAKAQFDVNTWKQNTPESVIQQITDMGIPISDTFNPFTIPLNVLTLIEQDLVKLQTPAIESIKNYLQWHAKYHGNWQDEVDMTDQSGGATNTPGGTYGDNSGVLYGAGVASSYSNGIALSAGQLRFRAKHPQQPHVSDEKEDFPYSVNVADNDVGGVLMPGLVEQSSESHDEGVPSSNSIGNLVEANRAATAAARQKPTLAASTESTFRPSTAIGSLLASQSRAEARAARREEERRTREAEHEREEFVKFRSSPSPPEIKGKTKSFSQHLGVDIRGIPRVQPLEYKGTTSTSTDKKRQFHVMSAGGHSETHPQDAAPVCLSYSVAERTQLTSELRTSLLGQVDSCDTCWKEFKTIHTDSIDSLLSALIPAQESNSTVESFNACTYHAIRIRLHSTVSALLYLQTHFLQPYYTYIYGDVFDHQQFDLTSQPKDDLEYLYLFAVQVAQNHLHRPASAPIVDGADTEEEWSLSRLESASDASSMADWCSLMYHLATAHPRTNYLPLTTPEAVALGTGNNHSPEQVRFSWRKLIVHVNEILGWNWYETPKATTKSHNQMIDLRLRHTTHIGNQIDGIQQIMLPSVLDSFGTVDSVHRSNHSSHTDAYVTPIRYSSGRNLMSLAAKKGDVDSYSDGSIHTSDDQSLLEASLNNERSRDQLLYLLKRNNLTSTNFDVDGFLDTNSIAAFEILSERLVARLQMIYQAYIIDAAKSWHSDRSKSPSASYDFDPAIHGIDYLVWLDSMNYNPSGHVGLDAFALYNEDNVAMINKKVSADDKYTRETHLRNQVETGIWLKDVGGFERWRWSWAYPDAKKLLTHDQHIVFQWLESWSCTSNMSLAAMTACISSTIWALLQIVRYLITKPWQRSSLVRNGTMHYEQTYHEEYERRERDLCLYRILPIKIVTTYMSNFMLCTFVLALNFTYYNPLAMFFYLAIFRWLTSIIFDVYFVKFFMYLILFCFPRLRVGDLKPPLCPCSIPLSSSIMLLNPLRPANDDQLRSAVRKQIDLLWASSSQHIISILILQAEGNSTKTFRRYEGIIRALLYDDPDVPQHVKDRFFVFHVAEITKPHNMFKVMHWFFMRSEIYDPVTREFLFGIETAAEVKRTKKVIRRVPFGQKAPNWCSLNGSKELKFLDEIDAQDVEGVDDQDFKIDAADADGQKQLTVGSSSSSSSSSSMVSPRKPRHPQTNQKISLAERWKNFASGGPASSFDEDEGFKDPHAKKAIAVRPKKKRVIKPAVSAISKYREVKIHSTSKTQEKEYSSSLREDSSSLLPNDDDFPDELYESSVEIEDEDYDSEYDVVYCYSSSDAEEAVEEEEKAEAAAALAAKTARSPIPTARTERPELDVVAPKFNAAGKVEPPKIKAKYHSTYEPLVYLGGDTQYKGYDELGADAGILCTVQGLKNLTYFRNESKPGEPLLENFAVLDADNYVEPVTLLRMLATMTDEFMIWQPCIKFYNRDQSMYAYMKDFTNEHLGHFMNIANVWMFGGIRSFGKYFGRLKRFYYEECTSASCATTPEQYSFMFNICSGLLTLCCIMFCIRPLGEIYMYLLFVITPIITCTTCAWIWWTHRQLRQQAFDVSKLQDPNIGKGEDLTGFGPVQGDDVFENVVRGEKHVKKGGKRDRRRVNIGAAFGDSRKIHARFQNCFPLNRLFIQSEDARHGGPFGRAVYLMDDCIHESTPISPVDDNHREFSKWLPTFDMRDFLLLHTPLLWILQHLTFSIWLTGAFAGGFGLIFVYSFIATDLPSSLAQVWCFMLMMICLGMFWAFYSIREAMTEPVLMSLRACRFPELPERALYSEDLMIRGIWSETIWLMQFVLGIFCLLVPGTVEIAFPFLGEFHLMILLIFLIHPKFSAPLLTRLHYIFHPKWKGYWRSRAAIMQSNEVAKKKGIKILMKKGKKHLLENAGYQKVVKDVEAPSIDSDDSDDDEVVTIDEDGEQIVAPASTSKSITADELYELSKANNLTHTCLFETGHFNVCGRNLPKWNKESHLSSDEKYGKLKDDDGFVKDTRFIFKLPALEECGKKLDIDETAMLKKEMKLKMLQDKAEVERLKSDEEIAKERSSKLVAFPLGRASDDEESEKEKSDEDESAAASSAESSAEDEPSAKASEKSDSDSDASSSAASDDDVTPQKSKSSPSSKSAKSAIAQLASSSSTSSSSKGKNTVSFPLAGPELDMVEVSKDAAAHRAHLLSRAKTWNNRQYVIYREKRWQPITQMIFWLLHDLPVGIFEFTASTTVFGLKLLTKPPQVIWAMIGCCMEIKGLLLGIQTPGTWPSFVESTQTLPLSAYIQEYHVPMSVSFILFFLCLPSMPTLLAQSEYFTNPWYLAMFGLFFGSLFGLWPAYNSYVKLRKVVTNKSAGGWSQLRQLRWFRESWSFVCAILMFGGVIFFSFSSWMLRGSFPAVFFVRSFPILIASFVLGPGIAWLLGMSHGVLDVTTNPPRYRRAYLSMLLCVGVGMFILSCAGMFVFALTRVLLPLQRAMGDSSAGAGHGGTQVPTGDGAMTVILPFSLTYGEMIKAPWYFVIPYACIVYGSMLLAVLAWPAALVHQVWTWWFYWFKGGKEEEKYRVFAVDDIKQNLKERKEKLDTLEKSGASRDLIKSLAKDAAAADAATAASSSSSSTLPIDRPEIDDVQRGAGALDNKRKRRGAVTLNI